MSRRGRTARRVAGARAYADPAVQRGALLAATATHWYDARQNMSVSSWTPRNSGGLFAATQAVPTSQPSVTTIGAGTHPALLFDGVDDVLDLLVSKWALGNDATHTIVGYVQSNSAGTKGFINAGVAAAHLTTFIVLGQATGNLYYGHRTDNATAVPIGATPTCIGVSFTNATLTSQIYQAGVTAGPPVVHTAVTAGALDTCRIGGPTPFGSPAWSGRIAHLAIFESVALVASQHSDLNAYFASICA